MASVEVTLTEAYHGNGGLLNRFLPDPDDQGRQRDLDHGPRQEREQACGEQPGGTHVERKPDQTTQEDRGRAQRHDDRQAQETAPAALFDQRTNHPRRSQKPDQIPTSGADQVNRSRATGRKNQVSRRSLKR